MDIKISIIIPVYNVAQYLRECLDSVLAQTYADWEAICVDDGSTDGSGAILDEYAARDTRLRVIHQINAGVSSARNAGSKFISGEWVWYIDSDDAINPRSFEVIADYAECCPMVDILKVSRHEGVDKPKVWNDKPFAPILANEHDIERLVLTQEGAPQYIVRASIAKKHNFKPYRWLEDIIFMQECLCDARDILAIPDCLYFYRKRLGSAINSQKNVDKVEEILDAACELINTSDRSVATVRNGNAYSYWKWLHQLVYFTMGRCYFLLTSKDRGKLLKKWLILQDMMMRRYSASLEWRMRIGLIKFFHSGFLVKPLVLWGATLRGKVAKFL